MTVYGLTGKTGAGKSTVAALLSEEGYYLIDGDVLARVIVQKGKPALEKLAIAFGKDILLPDGSLDRRALARKAFSSKKNTDLLNSITHPVIYDEAVEEIEKAKALGFEKALFDAAALLESECRRLCDKIIVVTAPEEIRLERILSRDSISPEEAKRRMSAQKEDEYYLTQADTIIKNYPPYDLYKQLTELL